MHIGLQERRAAIDTALVYIVSANELFREGLVRLLSGNLFDHAIAVAASREIDLPDDENSVVVIDLTNRQVGMEACRELRAGFPHVRLVLLSPDCDTEELIEGFAAGADAYLVRSMSCEQLEAALRLVQLGFRIPDEPIVRALAPRFGLPGQSGPDPADLDCLSAREIEIVQHLIEGLPNKLISRQMRISDATVKVHVKAVLRKLHLRNRTQVATWALRSGLGMKTEPAGLAA
jgi:two-component system, NarL family, nitrate/nitrite response regulator NarL